MMTFLHKTTNWIRVFNPSVLTLNPSDASSFSLNPSDASEGKTSYDQGVDFLVDFSSDLHPSHTCFYFSLDAFLCAQSLDVSEINLDFDSRNLIIWFCIFEHALAYPIILLYIVIIKTSKTLFKTHFSSTLSYLC